jgi:hypothetical protein
VDGRLQSMQDEISRLTADLVDFTNKVSDKEKK